jgi:predicted phage baseplate assembly protein
MPIPLPNLDDRRFDDLVRELRALIPRYAPAWTDHNLSDPGITLIELFAWLTEALLYRLNRIPAASEARFLELLGARFRPAVPAVAELTVSAEGLEAPLVVPQGEPLVATPGTGDPLTFETVHGLQLTPGAPSGTVKARQIARVTGERLGTSDGQPFQTFRPARHHVVVLPGLTPPIVPAVTVDGESWSYRPPASTPGAAGGEAQSFSDSGPDDPRFTFDPFPGLVRFGDGGRLGDGLGAGRIPPAGAEILADYAVTEGRRGKVPADTPFRFARDLGVAATKVRGETEGRDPGNLEETTAEAIDLLRTRWRAITSEDFEDIAVQQIAGIARARCLPEVDLTVDPSARAIGHVSVIVVPRPGSGPPVVRQQPSAEQIAAVDELLDSRRLVTCRHHVVGPSYTDARLEARVVLSEHVEAQSVCRQILSRLESFFDPLAGGPEGTGWPFGRDVHVSEVCQTLEAIAAVDHVDEVVLWGREGSAPWQRYGDRLPVPTNHLVALDLGASEIALCSAEGGRKTPCAPEGGP